MIKNHTGKFQNSRVHLPQDIESGSEDVEESKLIGTEKQHTIILSLLVIQFTICKIQCRNINLDRRKMQTINKYHKEISHYHCPKKKKEKGKFDYPSAEKG